MPRGHKMAITQTERRRWLQQLESGKGITEIARAAGRDIRIVKAHIETAREEKQSADVKREFLLGVLQQHQEDMLAEVERLRHLIGLYPPTSVVPGDPIKVKIHEALREHMKRSSLIGLLDSYESAVRDINEEREQARNELARKEKEVLKKLPEGIITHPWVRTLMDDLESGLLDNKGGSIDYGREKQNGGRYEARYGTFNLTRSPISEDNIEAVIEAHKELVESARAHRHTFEGHRRRLKEMTGPIRDELDVLTIRRLVPGKCKYCPI